MGMRVAMRATKRNDAMKKKKKTADRCRMR